MKRGPSSLLQELEASKARYADDEEAGTDRRKVELVAALERVSLPGARRVERFHDVLLFLRAYPNTKELLVSVEQALARFERRADLVRHRKKLDGSGIAGTTTHASFFAPTAFWLARRIGERLRIDWKELKDASKLDALIRMLALYAETPGIDQLPFTTRAWLERLKGPQETDAAFLLRRFEALEMDDFVREAVYDDLDPPLILAPGPDTPSRTHAKYSRAVVHYRTEPLAHARPDLKKEIARPAKSVRPADARSARELIDIARGMMVAMSRDLDVFSYASDEDVRIADCGKGLLFAFIGFVPERRLMLETLYGYLVLQNGVPIGYGTVACLFGSAEVAYNVSPAFRGGEAALVFARLLASVRAIFGSDTFCLDPYQLGEENEEAVRSGSWWFYQKLGFRARDRAVLRLMREELARMGGDPSHRSSPATLRRLATAYVFLHIAEKREDVLGVLPLANVGLRVTDRLAARFGSERARAEREASKEAAEILGLRSFRSFSRGERLAWTRWSPLVPLLPGIGRFSARDRAATVEVIRAKGGVRESDFAARFDRHARLRAALAALARS